MKTLVGSGVRFTHSLALLSFVLIPIITFIPNLKNLLDLYVIYDFIILFHIYPNVI